jgi:phage gp36-like protein
MAFLETSEIKTHLYGGIVDEISREDESILQDAIIAATGEVEGYIRAYDTTAIFSATGTERHPTLLLYTKDIAVWHYIQLANPGVEMELRKYRYEQALEWLGKVQSGKINPTMPYPSEPPAEEANNYIKYGTIEKRKNNF